MFQLYNAARQTLELKKTPNSKHLKYLHLDTNVLKKSKLHSPLEIDVYYSRTPFIFSPY